MNKKNWFWAGGGLIVLMLVFIVGVQWFSGLKTAEAMTKEEVQKMIEEKYAGEIKNVVLQGNEYTIDLKRGSGTYQVSVDAEDGTILSLIRTGMKMNTAPQENEEKLPETPVKTENSTDTNVKAENKEKSVDNQEEKTTEPVAEEKPKRISEAEAKNIALGEVKGTVDEVETEIMNGVAYYFVEIETNDDEEAVVQINAISGEIKSVTWDD